MTKSAILHDSFLLPFLKMALDENLIEKFDDQESDGLYSKITRVNNNLFKNSLLEQVVLTPELLFLENKYYENYIKGYLVDNGIIRFISRHQSDLTQLSPVSPVPFILNIMNLYEERYNAEDYERFKEKLINTVKEQQEYTETTKKVIPGNMELAIQDILSRGKISVSKEYNAEEISLFHKWQNNFNEIRHFTNATTSFIDLYTTSVKNKSLLKIPIFSPPISNTTVVEANEYVVLRIVCNELGVFTHKPSLKDSLELSSELATIELRKYIDLWKDKLYDGDINSIIKIKKEIQRANYYIDKVVPLAQNTSRIVTYIGVSTSIADQFINHIAPAIGLTISIVGGVGQYASDLALANYRWAMFNKN